MSWTGAGSNGQLGHDSDQPVLFPKVVVDLLGAPSALVACGRRHTLVYQPDQHRIYSFGLNGSGQLGDGTAKSVSVPVLVKSLAGHRVHLLAAGGDQSFVVTEPDAAAAAAAAAAGPSLNGAAAAAMATDLERPSSALLKRRSAPGSPRDEHSDEEATLRDGAGPTGGGDDDRPERGARSSQSAKVQAVSSPSPAPSTAPVAPAAATTSRSVGRCHLPNFRAKTSMTSPAAART